LVHTWQSGFSIAATTWFCSTPLDRQRRKHPPSQVLRPHAISPDNIENRQLLAELVDDADVIVHLAAAVGVKLIVESPVRTIETNVNGTQLILEAASKKRKLVLTASTSEVYGKNTNVPFHEDADLS